MVCPGVKITRKMTTDWFAHRVDVQDDKITLGDTLQDARLEVSPGPASLVGNGRGQPEFELANERRG